MRKCFFKREATKCREMAVEFAGRPEQPFLLDVANAFEDLAYREGSDPWLRRS